MCCFVFSYRQGNSIGNKFNQILWIPQCYKWKYLHQRLGMLFLQQNLNTEMMICLPCHLLNAINIFATTKDQKISTHRPLVIQRPKHVFFLIRGLTLRRVTRFEVSWPKGCTCIWTFQPLGLAYCLWKGAERWGLGAVMMRWDDNLIDVIDHNV